MEKDTAHKKSWICKAAEFDVLYLLKQTLLAFFVLLFTCEQVYGISCMVGDRCCATHVDRQEPTPEDNDHDPAHHHEHEEPDPTLDPDIDQDLSGEHQHLHHDSENLEEQAEHQQHQGGVEGSCHCCGGNQESSYGCTCKHGEKPLQSPIFLFPELTGVNEFQFNYEFSVQYDLHGHSQVVQPETPPPRI